jgi:uncharacterized membrane protein YjfL (UPF0719 family)
MNGSSATWTLLSALAYPPVNLLDAVVATVVFGLIGIVLTIVAFKLMDWLTPGNLQEEIIQKNNLAAAVLCGAFLIGVSIVIAAVVG